jgi:hypothetical protein
VSVWSDLRSFWFWAAMAGWWRGWTLLLLLLCSVSLSAASNGKSLKHSGCWKGSRYMVCKWGVEVVKAHAIFKFFWIIGGILHFQIMGREDICF